MLYLQNTTDGLYYPVTLVDTGDEMTINWATTGGVATPPAYTPEEGEPLINVTDYLAIFGLSELDVPLAQWTWAALYVSDAVEAYCYTSWRTAVADPLLLETDDDYEVTTVTPPPPGLRVVIAQIVRDVLGGLGARSANGQLRSAGVKSESLRNYSYTLMDSVQGDNAIDMHKAKLLPYRQLFVGV